MQANFCSQSTQGHRKSPLKKRISLFAHWIYQWGGWELARLGGDRGDKLQLDRYIKVLQIQKEEMDLVKITRPPDSHGSANGCTFGQKDYSAPQDSRLPQLATPAPVLVVPLPNLGTRHHESKVNVSDVISQIFWEVCLQLRNYWLWLQSQRAFQGATTEEATALQRRHNPKWPSHCHFSWTSNTNIFGRTSLPLRMMRLLWIHGFRSTQIQYRIRVLHAEHYFGVS